jgi:hypothetical protein
MLGRAPYALPVYGLKLAQGLFQMTGVQPRLVAKVVVVSLSLALGCGGSPPDAKSPEASQDKTTKNSGSADGMIRDLLSGMDQRTAVPAQGAGQGPGDQSQTQSPHQPVSTGGKLDTWDSDIATIKSKVPTWDNGVGIVLKFLKEDTGERLTLIFIDPTAPVFKQGTQSWLIHGQANSSSGVLAHVVLSLKQLETGHQDGNPTKHDMIMSVGMGAEWDGTSPEVSWSVNDGSWCEISLRNGQHPGDLEGELRGKLFTNNGESYQTIESGYMYINR